MAAFATIIFSVLTKTRAKDDKQPYRFLVFLVVTGISIVVSYLKIRRNQKELNEMNAGM